MQWRIGMPGEEFLGLDRCCAIRTRWSLIVLRAEYDHWTRLGMAALAIATTGGLDDGIERTEGAKSDGKIYVYSGFDELRGD